MFNVGDWVVCGKGSDADYGVVIAINQFGVCEIHWQVADAVMDEDRNDAGLTWVANIEDAKIETDRRAGLSA